ncbi:MAG: ATP phosphoribosyltransferase, partial [Nitrospina sp.]|nr:ATP phosphoribosyltransferase [Nitrospina sp.]
MNKDACQDKWKKTKVDRLVLMLQGAMAANGRVGLMLNAPQKNLKEIINVFPDGKKPTISALSDTDWVALNVILEEKLVRDIVPDLKDCGAEDIVEYPLNKIIH